MFINHHRAVAQIHQQLIVGSPVCIFAEVAKLLRQDLIQVIKSIVLEQDLKSLVQTDGVVFLLHEREVAGDFEVRKCEFVEVPFWLETVDVVEVRAWAEDQLRRQVGITKERNFWLLFLVLL